jgi:hypothetical protein
MLIYLFTFFISLCFFYLAEKTAKSKKLFLTFCFLGILSTSMLAGFRNIEVGVDVKLYVTFAFDYAKIRSLPMYLSLFSNSALFYTSIWIITKLFHSIVASLFFIEFFIEFFVLLSLLKSFKKESKYHIWIGMLVYYLVFYNYSLNLMRQLMALSVLLFALQYYLLENKALKYFFVTLIAILLHNTALIGFILFFVYRLHSYIKRNGFRKRFILNCSIFFTVILLIVFIRNYIHFFGNLVSSLENFLSSTLSLDGTINAWFLFALIIIWGFILERIFKKRISEYSFYKFTQMLGLLIFTVNFLINNAYRISFYFLFPVIVYYPYVLEEDIVIERKGILLKTSSIVFLLFFWFVMFALWNANNTIPYTSKVLGIY